MGILNQIGNAIGGSMYGANPSASDLAASTMGLGTLGTGVGALSNVMQGVAGYSSGRANAAIIGRNAQIAMLHGQMAESTLKMQYGARAAEQVATAASRNVITSGGSAAALPESTREIENLDVLATHYNTALESYGYQGQAEMERRAASSALVKGMMGGAQSLIGGAYGLSDKWLQYKAAFGDKNASPLTLSSPEVVANKPLSADDTALGSNVPKNFPYNVQDWSGAANG